MLSDLQPKLPWPIQYNQSILSLASKYSLEGDIENYVLCVLDDPIFRRVTRLIPWAMAEHLMNVLQYVSGSTARSLSLTLLICQPGQLLDSSLKGESRRKTIKALQDIANQFAPLNYPSYLVVPKNSIEVQVSDDESAGRGSEAQVQEGTLLTDGSLGPQTAKSIAVRQRLSPPSKSVTYGVKLTREKV